MCSFPGGDSADDFPATAKKGFQPVKGLEILF